MNVQTWRLKMIHLRGKDKPNGLIATSGHKHSIIHNQRHSNETGARQSTRTLAHRMDKHIYNLIPTLLGTITYTLPAGSFWVDDFPNFFHVGYVFPFPSEGNMQHLISTIKQKKRHPPATKQPLTTIPPPSTGIISTRRLRFFEVFQQQQGLDGLRTHFARRQGLGVVSNPPRLVRFRKHGGN